MKNYLMRLILVVSTIILGFIWRPFLIFAIPGLVIIFIPLFKKIDLIDLLAYVAGISMCFWICSFWFLKYIPLSLRSFFIAITVASFLIIIYSLIRQKFPYTITLNYSDFLLIGLCIFIFYLRLIPMSLVYVSTGADMSVHTYIAELIQKANGVPNNYYPILGINEFNSYPVGFSSISALIALLGEMPSYRGAFFLACLTYGFLTLFLVVLLKRFVRWEIAFISSIAFSFLTINPQFVSSWGGNPSVYALALCILFISCLYFQNKNIWIILFSSLCLAAVLLTHTQTFLLLMYCFGIPFLIYALIKRRKSCKFTKLFIFLVLFVIIISPYLGSVNRGIVTPEILQTVKKHVTESFHAWDGTIYNFLWTIPAYIKMYLFGGGRYITYLIFNGLESKIILAVSLIGVIFLFRRSAVSCLLYAGWLIIAVLLILNTRYWILPFSYAIYPERVPLLALIPLSVYFAHGLEAPLQFIKTKNKYIASSILFYILIVISMFLAVRFNEVYYTNSLLYKNSVTKADIKALRWLDEHVDENAIIKNSYGDAGLWIPAIIFRPITTPQVHTIYLGKVKKIENPEYVYIGKKCVYGRQLKVGDFVNKKGFKLIYSEDGVYIFKIVAPFLPEP